MVDSRREPYMMTWKKDLTQLSDREQIEKIAGEVLGENREKS